MTIADAPWIRDAEINGMPGGDAPDPRCPICNHECERIYFYKGETDARDVLGCDLCIDWEDAATWIDEHRED